MRPNSPLRIRKQSVFGQVIACLLAAAFWSGMGGNGLLAQGGKTVPAASLSVSEAAAQQAAAEQNANWRALAGLKVLRITYEGVNQDRLAFLRITLAQAVGEPLDEDKVATSLRQLFATGLFDSIEAAAVREGGGVALIFRGTSRTFIGTVTVEGAKGGTINTQLERASRLTVGTRFTEARMQRAVELMKQVMADNGFRSAQIKYTLTPDENEQLVNIAVHVTPGVQSRVGAVAVTGDSGMNSEEFRRHARLKAGQKVNRDTNDRALSGVLKHYRKERRLEADVKLEAETYAANKVDYKFAANRGPLVHVRVDGAKLSEERIQRLVPIYEEGTVDEDLLNEGNRRIRDYFQSQGYFDVVVSHTQETPAQGEVLIVFHVELGSRRRVESVKVAGNKYFDSGTLEDLLNVRARNAFDRQGIYSQALVSADIAALSDVYHNNGFSKVKITPETGPTAQNGVLPGRKAKKISAPLTVVYRIEEGPQQRVGKVTLEGNEHVDSTTLVGLMNTVPEQLHSPRNLAGDRDALLSYYMTQGFNDARVDVSEAVDKADANKMDVVFHIYEGPQSFVRKVLVTGLHYTRPSTVAPGILLKPGDPLNMQALQETQRNFYDLALFNEVNTAVQNPAGAETDKTILIQAFEARRWTLTYGAGFEAQTGTPQNNCAGYIATGVPCSPNGHTGVSLRGLLAVTRNNLFGREQSASIQGTYGALEQKANLIYQNPHLFGSRKFALAFTGGYANSQAVTTYVAAKLDGGLRITQTYNNPAHWLSRANTFIYEFDFRRVKVARDSLQIYPNFLSELSAPVRVGGPGFTWIRDTRDSPVDAHKGTYTSFQEFLSESHFGAEAQFNRIDLSNSSFYSFDKGKLVLARNTRYGQERAFGNGSSELIPLPERLYAGGATSLRGFSTNAAGPRDPQTGYPIGGAGALVNSTELRLPPPTLPYFGDTVSFVLFHDMGNIFNNSRDVWPSLLRVSQPDRDACKDPQKQEIPPLDPDGPTYSTGKSGKCSFNYFSHTLGIGLRYHTPVGPLRFDFSYNLNPPIYPVTYNYSDINQAPHVGEASHFNFFFSLGQTF